MSQSFSESRMGWERLQRGECIIATSRDEVCLGGEEGEKEMPPLPQIHHTKVYNFTIIKNWEK